MRTAEWQRNTMRTISLYVVGLTASMAGAWRPNNSWLTVSMGDVAGAEDEDDEDDDEDEEDEAPTCTNLWWCPEAPGLPCNSHV